MTQMEDEEEGMKEDEGSGGRKTVLIVCGGFGGGFKCAHWVVRDH